MDALVIAGVGLAGLFGGMLLGAGLVLYVYRAVLLPQPIPIGPLGQQHHANMVAFQAGPQAPAGVAAAEPALPPLESAIGRLRDHLIDEYRAQGVPVSREEADAQARLMMADAGMTN